MKNELQPHIREKLQPSITENWTYLHAMTPCLFCV